MFLVVAKVFWVLLCVDWLLRCFGWMLSPCKPVAWVFWAVAPVSTVFWPVIVVICFLEYSGWLLGSYEWLLECAGLLLGFC